MIQSHAASPAAFFSRDTSWLDFNSRVLDEAACGELPLLERLHFLAIHGNNADEFIMVRIAELLHRQRLHAAADPAGKTPCRQLRAAALKIRRQLNRRRRMLNDVFIPLLAEQGIHILAFHQLVPEEKIWTNKYFAANILPLLTPLAVAGELPLLNSGSLQLALRLKPPKQRRTVIGFVEIPAALPRWLELPAGPGRRLIWIEDVIIQNIQLLFAGCRIHECQLFRILRDMDFTIEEEDRSDWPFKVKKRLLQKSQREPVYLEFADRNSDSKLQSTLRRKLKIPGMLCFDGCGRLHPAQLQTVIPLLQRPDLQFRPWPRLPHPAFARYASVIEAIREQNYLLHCVPYQSFDPVTDFIEQAAADPQVLSIKQTLYRVGVNSPVIKALKKAAEMGKQVTVLVELRARFEESNNIAWAEILDRAGAHVIYGLPGLKVHCKVLLVSRLESGSVRHYVHYSSGNYNAKTAEVYADIGYFTSDPALADDAIRLFNYLTTGIPPVTPWQKISVAPLNLRQTFRDFIEREINFARAGMPAEMLIKVNSFSDPELIALVHKAAANGVAVKMLVRGICCFRRLPEEKHVEIYSIVDRYLEHSRVFCFRNGGETQLFVGSADWMIRNLDHRVEVILPIQDRKSAEIILQMLYFQFNNPKKRRCMHCSGVYHSATSAAGESSAQESFYNFLRQMEVEDAAGKN